jgi:hypothetical protein
MLSVSAVKLSACHLRIGSLRFSSEIHGESQTSQTVSMCSRVASSGIKKDA